MKANNTDLKSPDFLERLERAERKNGFPSFLSSSDFRNIYGGDFADTIRYTETARGSFLVETFSLIKKGVFGPGRISSGFAGEIVPFFPVSSFILFPFSRL